MNQADLYVSGRLIPIVDEWKQSMKDNNIPIARFDMIKKIQIVPDHIIDYKAGYCDPRMRLIYISQSTMQAGHIAIKGAVWHELGHYVFRLEHQSGLNLMNPDILTDEVYLNNWDTLKTDYLKQCIYHEERGIY